MFFTVSKGNESKKCPQIAIGISTKYKITSDKEIDPEQLYILKEMNRIAPAHG